MNLLAQYQACLFDVDKTLTNSSRKVTKRTQEALTRLYNAGFVIGVCSGRYYATLKDLALRYFPPNCKHISAGGGQVIDSKGKVYWERRIEATVAKQLVSQAVSQKFALVICEGATIYSNLPLREPEVKDVLIESLEYLPRFDVPLITVYDIDPEFEAQLSNLKGISFKRMLNYERRRYVDITAKGVTKRQGLEEWCKLVNILPEKVIGFGDAENDREFLESVGYAVAMGNASESIKTRADEVIGSCDEEGVAAFIERNL